MRGEQNSVSTGCTARTPNKTAVRALRDLLNSRRLEFIMEAHNGLSARIVEEAGFAGIWASGLALFGQAATLTHVGTDNAPKSAPRGRWIGMMRSRGEGRIWIREALDTLCAQGRFETAGVPDLLNELMAAGRRIDVIYITGHWLDVNNLDDLRAAAEFAHGVPQ